MKTLSATAIAPMPSASGLIITRAAPWTRVRAKRSIARTMTSSTGYASNTRCATIELSDSVNTVRSTSDQLTQRTLPAIIRPSITARSRERCRAALFSSRATATTNNTAAPRNATSSIEGVGGGSPLRISHHDQWTWPAHQSAVPAARTSNTARTGPSRRRAADRHESEAVAGAISEVERIEPPRS